MHLKFWIIFIALPLLQAELIQVIQLARHGARTPNSFEYIPNQFNEDNGQLTVLGMVQQYFLGQEMRKRYVEDLGFLSHEFNSSEVVFKSSFKNRTVRSAYSFVSGMYPQEDGIWYDNPFAEEFPLEHLLPLKKRGKVVTRDEIKRVKINEKWAGEIIQVIPKKGDLHFHAFKSENCPSIEKMVIELRNSKEFEEMEKFFGLTLYPELASGINRGLGKDLLNSEELTIKKAKSVLDNYRCNLFHGQEHPTIDEQTLNILKRTRHFYAYKTNLLDEMVRSVSGTKLFEEFMKYTSSARDSAPDAPKYVFYSAHDTNLEVLFSIFLLESIIDSVEHYNIIPFSSVFSIELHKEQESTEGPNGMETKDSYYVQILFNDEPQLMKLCVGYKCSLEQFHSILERHIVPNIEDFCSAGLVASSAASTEEEIAVSIPLPEEIIQSAIPLLEEKIAIIIPPTNTICYECYESHDL
jgi:hypothetical protein